MTENPITTEEKKIPEGWDKVAVEMGDWHPDLRAHAERQLASRGITTITEAEQPDSADNSTLVERVERPLSKEQLLRGALEIAKGVVESYPQTDEEGNLDYSFAGSLAVMLLAQASKVELLDPRRIPEIDVTEMVTLSDDVRQKLHTFARPIGDLDYVPTSEKRTLGKNSTKVFKTLSDNAKRVLRYPGVLGADPLATPIEYRAMQIQVGDKTFYIPDITTITGYKVVHLAESFDRSDNPEKFTNDLEILIEVAQDMKGYDEVVASTHAIIFAYGKDKPNDLEIPYHKENLPDSVRRLFDDVISVDVDVEYLSRITHSKERAIGFLKILHKFQSQEAKQAIADALNRNQNKINKWDINTRTPKNLAIFSDIITRDPEFERDFRRHEHIDDDTPIQDFLRTHPYMFKRLFDEVEDKTQVDMAAGRSEYLAILIELDEVDLARCIAVIDKAYEQELFEHSYEFETFFNDEFMKSAMHDEIFERIERAFTVLSPEDMKTFVTELRFAVIRSFDSSDFHNITDDERITIIRDIFGKYEL